MVEVRSPLLNPPPQCGEEESQPPLPPCGRGRGRATELLPSTSLIALFTFEARRIGRRSSPLLGPPPRGGRGGQRAPASILPREAGEEGGRSPSINYTLHVPNRGLPKPEYKTQLRAQRLRRETTPPERIFWSRLRRRALGVRFRRQHPIGPFIADFYCSECQLVVEIDSRTHDGRLEYDSERDAWMRDHGLHVIRITASDVSRDLEGVLRAIQRHVRELQES